MSSTLESEPIRKQVSNVNSIHPVIVICFSSSIVT